MATLQRAICHFRLKSPPLSPSSGHNDYINKGQHDLWFITEKVIMVLYTEKVCETTPPTNPRISIHHRNHTSHLPHEAALSDPDPAGERRLELKSIKLQYISRPYKAACTDTRPRKNSSNINQVIENLCGRWMLRDSWPPHRYHSGIEAAAFSGGENINFRDSFLLHL